ncbi:hypothetical protein [Amycolatopsis sp.]|nr:hypothetical protein [Amycolatopsis sp.]HVV08986.1 hypothetical protein [Amycolatopsis sp.]
MLLTDIEMPGPSGREWVVDPKLAVSAWGEADPRNRADAARFAQERGWL